VGDFSQHDAPVRAKAVLFDPAAMLVLWTNEGTPPADVAPTTSLEQAIPLAESMGVLESIKSVAETGVPRHLRTNLVSTGRGDMAIATSVYRLPDGMVLVLSEHAWQPGKGRDTDGGLSKSGRRRR
jgi:hypothetical protein